jgi:hypothetical protein
MTPLSEPGPRKEVIPTGGGTPRLIAKEAGFVYSWSSDLSRVLTIKLPYDGCIYSLDTHTGKSLSPEARCAVGSRTNRATAGAICFSSSTCIRGTG